MPDETTSKPAPVSPAPEAPIPAVIEPVVPIQAEILTESAPAPEPIPEPPSGHLGGNDPIDPATTASIPSFSTVETSAETPVAITDPAPTETLTLEVTSTETTQPAPTEPVIEAVPEATTKETLTPAQVTTEATSVSQVETPASAQIPEPVVAQVPVSAPTPEPVTPAPTPAQVVATVVTPVVTPVIAQTFTKSIRELFTKAQLAIQNRKRKKIDRILTLFAKQTMITNNEVENLLHVSDSTATRYLATLTKEGKIKQNTKKGQATSYSKI